MKLLNLTAAISVALVSVLPDVCLSQTFVNGVKYPEASNAHLPNCYIKTTDNRILDLTNMCTVSKEADESSTSVETRSSTRSSMQGRGAMQSSRNSPTCSPLDDEDCEEWAASRPPVVPY